MLLNESKKLEFLRDIWWMVFILTNGSSIL